MENPFLPTATTATKRCMNAGPCGLFAVRWMVVVPAKLVFVQSFAAIKPPSILNPFAMISKGASRLYVPAAMRMT
jgi:hypothetical protein